MGSQSQLSRSDKTENMNSQLFVSLMLVAASQASPLKVSQTKAASPYVNIGCQCSPLTFVDQYGTIQGNCKSVDSTGARWCYVASHHSSCHDLRFSARFPSNPWSYEACATPLPYAPLAPVAPVVPAHTHVPSAAYTVPVQQVQPVLPVHSHPVHSHPQPVYGSNTGTLPADYLGQFIPKKAGDAGSASKDAVKF